MAKDQSHAALIRLRQWRVDELRKEMALLEGERAEIVAGQGKLEARVAAEQTLMREAALHASVGDACTGGLTYGAFAGKVIADRAQLKERLARTEAALEEVRERLRQAFLDLKQVEIMADRARERARADAARAEQAAFDDAALTDFARRG